MPVITIFSCVGILVSVSCGANRQQLRCMHHWHHLGKADQSFFTSYSFHPQSSCLIFFKLTISTSFMDRVAFFPNHILFDSSYVNTGTASHFFMSILSQILSFSGPPNGPINSPPTSTTDLHYHFPPSSFNRFKSHSVTTS